MNPFLLIIKLNMETSKKGEPEKPEKPPKAVKYTSHYSTGSKVK